MIFQEKKISLLIKIQTFYAFRVSDAEANRFIASGIKASRYYFNFLNGIKFILFEYN